jgi:8-oxo-dGTP pyrophosphatase MutT (NUDIX family)
VKLIRNSAKAIIVVNGRLLTIQNEDADGFFYILPGGGQLPGETLTSALQRECREEISVDVDVGDLVCIREYIGSNHEFDTADGDVHAIEFMFDCSLREGATVRVGGIPDSLQVGFLWIPLDQLEAYPFYPKALGHILAEPGRGSHLVYLGDVN